MPGLAHVVPRSLRRHGQPIALTRKAHRKVRDINALLHLTPTLLHGLTHLKGDQTPQGILVVTHGVAHLAHQFPSQGPRHGSKSGKSLLCRLHHLTVLGSRCLLYPADDLAGGGVLCLEPRA